uniref:NEDD4 family-interacting protein 1-like n=1 Tax=Hirondellea gigas TaxID=1518452 RepID=A0A2P2I314_9CRUS
MPTFLRYERVPVWEEDTSDASMSNSSTPQHLATLERTVPSMASDTEETQTITAAAATAAVGNGCHTDSRSTDRDGEAASGSVGTVYTTVATTRGYAALPPVDEYEPPTLDMSAPPPYSESDDISTGHLVINMPTTTLQQQQNTRIAGAVLCGGADSAVEMPDGAVMQPPSYEEVQRIKAVEAELESGNHILLPPHTGSHGGVHMNGIVSAVGEPGDRHPGEDDMLGTDLVFFLAFAAAFFFNWLGFVLLVCYCQSVAGRSGALAGFGLSLAKWAVIVRHTTALAKEANTWLLWLIMVLGLMICMRAVLQYLNAKREWQHASPASRHRFWLFH